MKKFVSIVLCFIIMMSVCVCSNVNVNALVYSYDPDAAISFAKNHCATDAKNHSAVGGTGACDKKWLCAEFVAECLVAGGFPKKLSAVAGLSGFAGQITKYGEKISSSKTGEGYVKLSSFNGKLSKGDPIMILYSRASGSGNGHVVIYSGETADGIVKVYAHNNRKQNEKLYVSSRTVEVFAVNLSSSKDNPKISFNKSSLSLGLTNNNTATLTATISGNYAHWETDWDGKYIGVERTSNGNTFTFKITSKVAGSSNLYLKCQDENYNTISEASVNINITYDKMDDFSFSYDPNGASGDTSPFKVKYGDDFIVLNNSCYKKGYHFSGWNIKRTYDNTWYVAGVGWCSEATIKNNNYQKKVYSNGQGLTLDPTWTSGLSSASAYVFCATWSENNMSVSYNGNGGTGNMEKTSFDFTWNYEIPSCDFMRPGYSFVGWNIYRINDGTWATVGYGWLTESELASQNVNKQVFSYGESYRIDNSWSNGCSDDYYQYEAYAIWEKNTVNICLDSNGGIGTSYIASLEFEDNLVLPECPFTRNGYTFDYWNVYRENDGTWATEGYGWLTSSQLESQGVDKQIFEVDDSYVIDDSWLSGCNDVYVDFVLVPHWKANAYTVSYNANGGSNAPASQSKTHDVNLTLSSAKPIGKSFTVSYNANGGTASTSSKTVSQTFTGWNTAANGNGTAYNAGATYSANASVTLYAQYANPSIGSLPAPTRSDYSFDGWYTAANGGTKITDSTSVTANTTVYAHWTKNAETKATVKGVKVDHNTTLNYKSTYMLVPEITADEGAKYTVKYESSNTSVATVGKDGKIYGAKKGNATITCTVTDSYGNVVKDSCNVNVDYSGAQWFIIIVLFGWIWYI